MVILLHPRPLRLLTPLYAVMCRLCSGLGRVREWVGPEPWRTRDVVCSCRAGELAHARWERALRASDIAPKLLTLDFAGYDAHHNPRHPQAQVALAAALAAAHSWTDDASRAALPWLLLYGGPGTGKTHLLAAAFNALLAGGRYPLYTVVPTLLDHVRDGLDSANGREYGARFKAVCEAPILILDDLGAEKRSDWSDELLFKLLDYRYREELPTAVASNLIPADLEPRIASRLQDRALGAALLMSGPDYRLSGPIGRRRSAEGVRRVMDAAHKQALAAADGPTREVK